MNCFSGDFTNFSERTTPSIETINNQCQICSRNIDVEERTVHFTKTIQSIIFQLKLNNKNIINHYILDFERSDEPIGFTTEPTKYSSFPVFQSEIMFSWYFQEIFRFCSNFCELQINQLLNHCLFFQVIDFPKN